MRQITRTLSGRVLVSAGATVVLVVSLGVTTAGSRQVQGAHAATTLATPVNYKVARMSAVTPGNEQSPVTCAQGNTQIGDVFPIATFSWSVKPSGGVITSSPVVMSAYVDWYTPDIETLLANGTTTLLDVCFFNLTSGIYTPIEQYAFTGCLVSAVSTYANGGGVGDTFTLTCQSVTQTVSSGSGSNFIQTTFTCVFGRTHC